MQNIYEITYSYKGNVYTETVQANKFSEAIKPNTKVVVRKPKEAI